VTNTAVSDVQQEETLARFIMFNRYIRKEGGRVHEDAFMPPRDGALSVTRHNALLDGQLWDVGLAIGALNSQTLYGRADVTAAIYRSVKLDVKAVPVPGNDHHAEVTGWPSDKPARKRLALLVAAQAVTVPYHSP
jgi:hypothetical protein